LSLHREPAGLRRSVHLLAPSSARPSAPIAASESAVRASMVTPGRLWRAFAKSPIDGYQSQPDVMDIRWPSLARHRKRSSVC